MLMLSKEQLVRRVLNDPRIQIYGCGLSDVRSGQIDRRVLATMLYLAGSGLKPSITSLKCGHGYLTSSGNVSEHTTGTAMDIGAINGIVIRPSTQGPGSITDVTIQALLKLQGTMKPHQIISLMTFSGADNTLALGDHDDHIHVGWRPLLRREPPGGPADQRRAQARPVDQADRPPRRDRQPGGARAALAVRHQGRPQARLAGPPRRVASVARRRVRGAFTIR